MRPNLAYGHQITKVPTKLQMTKLIKIGLTATQSSLHTCDIYILYIKRQQNEKAHLAFTPSE